MFYNLPLKATSLIDGNAPARSAAESPLRSSAPVEMLRVDTFGKVMIESFVMAPNAWKKALLLLLLAQTLPGSRLFIFVRPSLGIASKKVFQQLIA